MSIGPLLRDWRTRGHLSQMDLALEAGVSTRHLSFVETGRSRPSEDMLMHLAEQLQVPLRERNRLLLAAGYAPRYEERGLDEPEMRPIADAVALVLKGHEPFPALAVDHGWALVAANDAAALLMAGLPDDLLAPPLNVLRASLHPDGLAPRIRNLAEWRDHLLERLRRQIALTGDPALQTLFDELAGYPVTDPGPELGARNDVVVPLRLDTDAGELTFFSTVTTFGTPVDITVEELAIESFFPADERTAEALRAAA